MVQQHHLGAGAIYAPQKDVIALIELSILSVVVITLSGPGRVNRGLPDGVAGRCVHRSEANDGLEILRPYLVSIYEHYQLCYITSDAQKYFSGLFSSRSL